MTNDDELGRLAETDSIEVNLQLKLLYANESHETGKGRECQVLGFDAFSKRPQFALRKQDEDFKMDDGKVHAKVSQFATNA